MNDLLREAMGKAFAKGEHSIPCRSARQASSLRQKFYRYRREIREDSGDPFALLVDDLTFALDGKSINIIYADPEQLSVLKESLDDDKETATKRTA